MSNEEFCAKTIKRLINFTKLGKSMLAAMNKLIGSRFDPYASSRTSDGSVALKHGASQVRLYPSHCRKGSFAYCIGCRHESSLAFRLVELYKAKG